jgi:hypothetical protein
VPKQIKDCFFCSFSGAKQRKVNKRFKDYEVQEEKGGGGGPDESEDEEHKQA